MRCISSIYKQKILKKAKPISTLGGKKDLKELTAYAKQNGIDFYLDGITNYAYESDIFDGFFVFTDAARFVNREKAAIHPYSTVTYAKRDRQEPHYLLKGTLIPEMIDNLANTCEEYDAYLSFRDVGRELNSDYYRKNLRLKEERPSFDQIRRWDTWREAPSEEKEYMKKALEVYMSININIRELSQEAQNHFKMLEQDVEFME